MKKFWSGEETRRNGDELFRVKVVGSNPAGPTICTDRAHQERIVNFLFHLKKKGYRKSTLEGYSDVLKHLARNVDIDDVEAVKAMRGEWVSQGKHSYWWVPATQKTEV